ncbi:MAG: hypothetical protein PHE65_08060, partial [Candidatus Omnitrophica bacterium]|nr:hypothetical protein [Candidatus Omnitrophota bacterium]
MTLAIKGSGDWDKKVYVVSKSTANAGDRGHVLNMLNSHALIGALNFNEAASQVLASLDYIRTIRKMGGVPNTGLPLVVVRPLAIPYVTVDGTVILMPILEYFSQHSKVNNIIAQFREAYQKAYYDDGNKKRLMAPMFIDELIQAYSTRADEILDDYRYTAVAQLNDAKIKLGNATRYSHESNEYKQLYDDYYRKSLIIDAIINKDEALRNKAEQIAQLYLDIVDPVQLLYVAPAADKRVEESSRQDIFEAWGYGDPESLSPSEYKENALEIMNKFRNRLMVNLAYAHANNRVLGVSLIAQNVTIVGDVLDMGAEYSVLTKGENASNIHGLSKKVDEGKAREELFYQDFTKAERTISLFARSLYIEYYAGHLHIVKVYNDALRAAQAQRDGGSVNIHVVSLAIAGVVLAGLFFFAPALLPVVSAALSSWEFVAIAGGIAALFTFVRYRTDDVTAGAIAKTAAYIAGLTVLSILFSAGIGAFFADPIIGRILTTLLAIVNIRCVTSIIVSARGGYTALNIKKLSEDEAKERITSIYKGKLADKINGFDAATARTYLRKLLYLIRTMPQTDARQQSVGPVTRAEQVQQALLSLELTREILDAWHGAMALINSVSGEDETFPALKQAARYLLVPPYFLGKILILFFAGRSIANADYVNKVNAGEIEVEDPEYYHELIMAELEADTGDSFIALQKRWLELKEKWFGASLNHPNSTGVAEFLKSRGFLTIVSVAISAPIIGLLGITGGWAFIAGIAILTYVLSGKESILKIHAAYQDSYKAAKYGLDTLDARQLRMMESAMRQNSKDTAALYSLRQGRKEAYEAGALYSRNPYEWFLLRQEYQIPFNSRAWFTGWLKFLPLGIAVYLINPIVPFKTIAKSTKNSRHEQFGAELFNLRIAFYSSGLSLSLIKYEIELAQTIGEQLGGAFEMLIGPWEGGENFRYPLLNIGHDLLDPVDQKIYTSVDAENDKFMAIIKDEHLYGTPEQYQIRQSSLSNGTLESVTVIDLANASINKTTNVSGAL